MENEKKPSRFLIWAARRYAGFDDAHIKLLPPDRWVFKNIRAAIHETARGHELAENISASWLLTGSILGAGAAVTAMIGIPALPLGATALAAAGLTGRHGWQKMKTFRSEIIPGVKKSLAGRFLAFQASRVKEAVAEHKEKNPGHAAPKPLKPGTALAKVFEQKKTAKEDKKGNTAPPKNAKNDKGATP